MATENTDRGSKGDKRLHVFFPAALYAKLVELKKATGTQNVAEVLRMAIKVYAFLMEARSNGNEIVLRDKASGTDRIVTFL